MKKKKYDWEIGQSPPNIELHSQNKHSVYEGYLKRYVEKLTLNPRRPGFKMFIVDGFCGGGVYLDNNHNEHLGSPFIVFNAIEKKLEEVREGRKNTLTADLHYYFVDKEKRYIDYLKKAHAEREINNETNYPVEYMKGEFESVYKVIIDDIKQHAPRTQRCIFILDQYGWSKVPFHIINDIFNKLSDAEIILTFTPDEIIDYVSDDNEKVLHIQKTLDNVGFDIEPRDLYEILNSADHPDRWMLRLAAQELLSNDMKKKLNSKFFTRYYIRNTKTHRHIMLVHLSHHQTAHNEMMEEHWENSNIHLNHQGYVGVSSLILGYDGKNENEFEFLSESFFEEREAKVLEIMEKQIPIILDIHKGVLSFGALMGMLRNEAPITETIVKKVIQFLLSDKEVEVINHKNGGVRTRTTGLHFKDQVKLPNQRRLFV